MQMRLAENSTSIEIIIVGLSSRSRREVKAVHMSLFIYLDRPSFQARNSADLNRSSAVRCFRRQA